jgi:carbamoyl-phosphate synthase/aspartate carbamoyltransferase
MLDVYTIREELGTVNGLTVTRASSFDEADLCADLNAVVGDLKNGRTVHSLVRVLAMYEHITLNYVAPPSLGMPESVKAELRRLGVAQHEYTNLDGVIGQTDVLYVTRVQQERFTSVSEYEAVRDAYIIDNDVLSRAKANMRVMHPLPRNNEIAPEVDYDPRCVCLRGPRRRAHRVCRAAYFRAARNGMYCRMALRASV